MGDGSSIHDVERRQWNGRAQKSGLGLLGLKADSMEPMYFSPIDMFLMTS